jgi:hypothetical protein
MNPIILYDSPEAATYRTNISGWVSRHGLYFGEDERSARYDGCTHRPCEECGVPVPRAGFTHCQQCRQRRDEKNFLALPSEPYTGQVVCNDDGEEFFFDEDQIREYADDREIPYENLRLRKCEPRYADEVDPLDIYEDLLPEDGELPDHVIEAFAVLNNTLRARKHERPICWMGVSVRVILPPCFDEPRRATTGGE